MSDNPQNIQPRDRVLLEISEEPDPVIGTVVRVYLDAIGSLVADVEIRPGDVRPQNVEFLTRVEPTYAQTVTRLARGYRDALSAGHDANDIQRNTLYVLFPVAGAAGISESDAVADLFDEIDAEPVVA